MGAQNKILFLGTVAFICVSIFFLVMTNHTHLPDYLTKTSDSRSAASSIANEMVGSAKLDPSKPAMFASRVIEHGAFNKYDRDNDHQLNEKEFHSFLVDLAASRLLPERGQILPKSSGATSQQQIARNSTSTESTEIPQVSKEADASSGTVSSVNKTADMNSVVASTTPGSCPELSKELIQSFSHQGTIMLTVCDWRIFETFGINWMKHLNGLGVKYYIVGATDKKTADFLSGQGNHPCFKFFEEGVEASSQKEYKYGDDHYRAATWRKVTVVEKIVDWGFNVIHSDVDVVWFRDPLPYFLGEPCKEVDVATSTDLISTSNPKGDEGLEVAIHQHVNLNTGIYFVKASEGGRHFMKQWADLRVQMKGDNDQVGLYKYIRGAPMKIDHPLRRMNIPGGARVGLLSVSVLLNGYSYFIPRLHEAQNVKPLGIHMTWLPLSREGKFHRMRDGMLYHDAPSYYKEPMFLAADLDFPPTPEGYNEWMDTETMIQYHLRAMDKQLIQVYRVMAIATMLNRTLILPKMQCFCYKNWFMMDQCRIPGDKVTVFPMECHLDQWLRPKVLYNYGSQIVGQDGAQAFTFREHTFLDNPRFPGELRKEELTVVPGEEPCPADGQKTCSAQPVTINDKGQRVVLVPKSLRQKQLLSVLQPHRDVKILRIQKPMRLFGGFEDINLKESFEIFADKVASNWCCRDKPFIAKGMKEKEKLAITESLTNRVFLDDKKTPMADPPW